MKPRRHEYWALTFALFLALYWMPETSSGVTFCEVSMESMTDKASLIVIGKVTKAKGRWNSEHTMINTYVDIAVLDVLKEDKKKNKKEDKSVKTVTIIMEGGTVGSDVIHSWMLVPFEINEEVLVYLDNEGDFYTLAAEGRSKFLVKDKRIEGSSLSPKDIARQTKDFGPVRLKAAALRRPV